MLAWLALHVGVLVGSLVWAVESRRKRMRADAERLRERERLRRGRYGRLAFRALKSWMASGKARWLVSLRELEPTAQPPWPAEAVIELRTVKDATGHTETRYWVVIDGSVWPLDWPLEGSDGLARILEAYERRAVEVPHLVSVVHTDARAGLPMSVTS